MRKWITLLMTLLVGASASYANADMGQLTFEAGYRCDDISWKSDFNSQVPGVKRHTKFKDLDIFQIGLHGRTSLGYNLYLRGNAYFGWILDGKYHENVNTYFAAGGYNNFIGGTNNRRTNIVDDKYVYGIGAAIGYPFYFCDCTMILAPVVGYAYDQQNLQVDDESFNLYDVDGAVTVETGNCCCRNKWTNRWYAPFVGVDFNYRPYNQCWNLYAEIEYHFCGEFRGRRHTNNNLDGFGLNNDNLHAKNADAWLVTVGADYDLYNGWTAGIAVKYQDWHAHKRHSGTNNNGTDYAYATDFGGGHNNFKWSSGEVKLSMGKEF